LEPFWEQFPSQINEQIDAKIDTEKDMEICEISMRKLSYILILSEEGLHEKTYFSKKVNVRKPHESCSRIRVGEGSPKKKEIEKMRKILEKHSKIGLEKVMENV